MPHVCTDGEERELVEEREKQEDEEGKLRPTGPRTGYLICPVCLSRSTPDDPARDHQEDDDKCADAPGPCTHFPKERP